MVQWLRRLLMVVVAMLVVAGITVGVVQSANGENRQVLVVQPSGSESAVVGGIRGEREGWNLYAIDQLLRPLVVIAATIVVVAPLVEAAKQRRKHLVRSLSADSS